MDKRNRVYPAHWKGFNNNISDRTRSFAKSRSCYWFKKSRKNPPGFGETEKIKTALEVFPVDPQEFIIILNEIIK